jgi:hypothetical protein
VAYVTVPPPILLGARKIRVRSAVNSQHKKELSRTGAGGSLHNFIA